MDVPKKEIVKKNCHSRRLLCYRPYGDFGTGEKPVKKPPLFSLFPKKDLNTQPFSAGDLQKGLI